MKAAGSRRERRWVAIRGSDTDQGTTARLGRGHGGVPADVHPHTSPNHDGPATAARPAGLRDPASFEAALREAGHRVTDSRRAVHAALVEADGHLAPEQVVAHGGGAVNLATVYRVLSLFEDLGLARSTRLGIDGGASWELAHPDDHVHLVCDHCGEVDHHVGDAVSRLRGHLLDGHGFAAAQVDLVVRGTCASCRGVADDVVPPSTPRTSPARTRAVDRPTGPAPTGGSRARAGEVV